MKYDESNTCCFTGHRAERLPWGGDENDERAAALKRDIAETVAALYDAGVRRYICGMALGCDMYFAEAVLALGQAGERRSVRQQLVQRGILIICKGIGSPHIIGSLG